MTLTYHRRLQFLVLAGALPAMGLAAVCLLGRPWSGWVKGAALVAPLGVLGWALHQMGLQAQRPLQTLANLLAALREGDFSFRARRSGKGDALGEVFAELNVLADLLQQQRLQATEATALLREVMQVIDVAFFAFDDRRLLRLVNRAGAELLGGPVERHLGRAASDLGLEAALAEGGDALVDLVLPGRSGRFERRRSPFRQGGRPMLLLVLSDLTRPLREEERRTWQRLIRVLGHEINNSLAPIQSLSESLVRILEGQGEDWMEDARHGLGIIGNRAQGLGRFLSAYTQLAKLPPPACRPVELGAVVRRVAALETRVPVTVVEGPRLEAHLDEDQAAQALINLVRNAAEASLETGGGVRIGWGREPRHLEVWVQDEGRGLPEGGNLFTPFFTTKPGGSGIGLVLARQIAEAHGGSLVLENHPAGGAVAHLRLPV